VAALAGRARAGKPTQVGGAEATPGRLLEELPRARYAHLATHGFFADEQFREVFRLDRKRFEERGGQFWLERAAPGRRSPLALTGLVLAGANRSSSGLLTAEDVAGLDLAGMTLAVLSACDTGVGSFDIIDVEGIYGLQRAFHLAGCRDVVASLWKVDDDATAALMGLFYRNLWVMKLPPVEALRQAQLALYRDPTLIPKLAKRRGPDFAESDLPELTAKPTEKGRRAHTAQWAAFVLSGLGR
jgi:CHAT domain-containing protein